MIDTTDFMCFVQYPYFNSSWEAYEYNHTMQSQLRVIFYFFDCVLYFTLSTEDI